MGNLEDEELIRALQSVVRGLMNHKKWKTCHSPEDTVLRRLKNTNISPKTVQKIFKQSPLFLYVKKNGSWHVSLINKYKKQIFQLLEFDFDDLSNISEILLLD